MKTFPFLQSIRLNTILLLVIISGIKDCHASLLKASTSFVPRKRTIHKVESKRNAHFITCWNKSYQPITEQILTNQDKSKKQLSEYYYSIIEDSVSETGFQKLSTIAIYTHATLDNGDQDKIFSNLSNLDMFISESNCNNHTKISTRVFQKKASFDPLHPEVYEGDHMNFVFGNFELDSVDLSRDLSALSFRAPTLYFSHGIKKNTMKALFPQGSMDIREFSIPIPADSKITKHQQEMKSDKLTLITVHIPKNDLLKPKNIFLFYNTFFAAIIVTLYILSQSIN